LTGFGDTEPSPRVVCVCVPAAASISELAWSSLVSHAVGAGILSFSVSSFIKKHCVDAAPSVQCTMLCQGRFQKRSRHHKSIYEPSVDQQYLCRDCSSCIHLCKKLPSHITRVTLALQATADAMDCTQCQLCAGSAVLLKTFRHDSCKLERCCKTCYSCTVLCDNAIITVAWQGKIQRADTIVVGNGTRYSNRSIS
jgi:hypothetical protein